MQLLFGDPSVQVRGLDEQVAQLQELPPCDIDAVGRVWVMSMASGIHSPSPPNVILSLSTGTFTALSHAPFSTRLMLSHRLNHKKLLQL